MKLNNHTSQIAVKNTTHPSRPSLLLMVAAFAAVYLIWGSTYLGIKYAIETLPPFLMAGVRFTCAGAILYLWARLVRHDAAPDRVHWRTSLIVGGLLLVGGNGCVVWAEHFIPSSLAALLVASEPLWIVLLGWLFVGSARPTVKVVIGLLCGFAGVYLLIGGDSLTSQNSQGHAGLFGAILVLLAALSWASGSLYALRAAMPASGLLASAMQMLCGGLLLTIVGTLRGEWMGLSLSGISLHSAMAFVYLIIFGSIIGFTAYSWLLRNVTPARAATYAYVNPVVAVLLGWLFAGETVNARTMLGTAIIVGSVWLITSRGEEVATEGGDQISEEQSLENRKMGNQRVAPECADDLVACRSV